MKTRMIRLISALALLAATGMATAEDAGLELGILKCTVVPGSRVNLLIRSTADVKCTFKNTGRTERYIGETGIALGLDLSLKKDEVIAFTVISASSDVSPNSVTLDGKYVGGTASAAAGVGVGAKVLVGAGNQNISLQPLALEGSTGAGASAGVGFLYIEKVR